MKKITHYILMALMALTIVFAVPALSFADVAATSSVIASAPAVIASTPAVAVSVNGSAPVCLSITGPLYVGISGRSADVVALQTFLNNQKYLHVGATGYFGSLTLAAVKSYQDENGLPVTGYVGPLTLASLKNIPCSNSGGNGGGPGTSAPVTIAAPQGGEIWMKGTVQNITWQSFIPLTFAAGNQPKNQASYNLSLAPIAPQCVGAQVCPLFMIKPYDINTNIASFGNYRINYSWLVGTTTETTRTIPAGQYRIQVCVVNGDCTQSNIFTIVNASTTTGY